MIYTIPADAAPAKCRSCNVKIYWIRTEAGRPMPVDPNGEPHWASCPDRTQWKGKKRSDPDAPKPQDELGL